ncbi:MAG TPA: adenosylmethionine--8-amino-7-oxononanoate transaminase, partial [Coxiellaceae bacterium]|nr:adenosylmethionine--8-amino-7-oxononanoate transaminase [Coxiellaceae bacterium]
KQQKHQRYGYKIFQEATKLGAFMRPLGNTIYWLPPLNIKQSTLMHLSEITSRAINEVFA